MNDTNRIHIQEACDILAFSARETGMDTTCMSAEVIQAGWEQVQADFERLKRIMEKATTNTQ